MCIVTRNYFKVPAVRLRSVKEEKRINMKEI